MINGNMRRYWNGQASGLAFFFAVAGLVNAMAYRVTAEEVADEAKDARSPYASAQASSKLFDGVYSSVSVHDPNLCPWYGCFLLPRDIVFDNEAKLALENIRKLYSPEDESSAESDSTDSDNSDNSLTLLRSVGNDDHATLTLVGYKGGDQDSQVNQDRSFVISPYMSTGEADGEVLLQSQRRILGVFDGHGNGGEFVSDQTVHSLPDLIASKLDEVAKEGNPLTEEAVKNIIFDSFIEMDKTAPDFVTGGCTATIVLQFDDQKIYVGNTGDSRSLIATYRKSTGDVNVVYATREDKPDLPEEKARVEKMGGSVRLASRPGGTSRVMYTDKTSGREWGLAMSRSIGDWEAGKVGVIPDPIVDVLSVKDLVSFDGAEETCSVTAEGEQTCFQASEDIEVFAISATDGLLDFLPVDAIAGHVAKGLYAEDGPHLITACEELIRAAAGGWEQAKQGRYRDDIAIAVSRLT